MLQQLQAALGQIVLGLQLQELDMELLQFGAAGVQRVMGVLLRLLQFGAAGVQHVIRMLKGLAAVAQLVPGVPQLVGGGNLGKLGPIQRKGMPGQRCALLTHAPALGVLFQNALVPFSPVVVMLQVAKVGIAQPLAVSGPYAWHVHKGAEVAELAPEIPVFEHRQSRVEACTAGPHGLQPKKHGMDGQMVDAMQPAGLPGCVVVADPLPPRAFDAHTRVGRDSLPLRLQSSHQGFQMRGAQQVVVIQK